jgi:hypothetical protein
MPKPINEIRRNASELDALHRRIHETFALRARSQHDLEAWESACAAFHAAYSRLFYPGGDERWEAFCAGDSSELETAILFLEADPLFFRSGYMKEIIWHRLKRQMLSYAQICRLEQVFHAALTKQIRREFWHMVRFFRRQGSPVFWENVSQLASSANTSASTNGDDKIRIYRTAPQDR